MTRPVRVLSTCFTTIVVFLCRNFTRGRRENVGTPFYKITYLITFYLPFIELKGRTAEYFLQPIVVSHVVFYLHKIQLLTIPESHNTTRRTLQPITRQKFGIGQTSQPASTMPVSLLLPLLLPLYYNYYYHYY